MNTYPNHTKFILVINEALESDLNASPPLQSVCLELRNWPNYEANKNPRTGERERHRDWATRTACAGVYVIDLFLRDTDSLWVSRMNGDRQDERWRDLWKPQASSISNYSLLIEAISLYGTLANPQGCHIIRNALCWHNLLISPQMMSCAIHIHIMQPQRRGKVGLVLPFRRNDDDDK